MPSPMRNSKPLRRLGTVLAALIILFAIMTATAGERTEVTVAEKAVATILYPLQVATDYVVEQVQGVGQAVRELTRLREENTRLRAELREAEQLQARVEMLIAENERLRRELRAKERAEYPLLTADVISRSPDNWYRTVVINRGSRDGVQPNMAVVNWQGMVGKVLHTTPFTATVQLVIDAGFGQSGFKAGAKVPTGELGYIETGQGGHVRMRFFSSDPAVEVGQPVFTSGQGIIPPDLLIGYVETITTGESAFDKYASIRPAVDFNKLDVVHVVLHPTDRDRGANAP